MSIVRIGTRGSDLALAQTRLVIEAFKPLLPDCVLEESIIRTHGDNHTTQAPIEKDWPVGAFVSAIERALLHGEIDVAVHSYKDLPTDPTPGLAIAAVPERGSPHDVLVTHERQEFDALPQGLRIGTSSPRRAAQLQQIGDIDIVPIRGNVPTRLRKVQDGELDGVVLAAAGLERLGVMPEHMLALPIDRFPTAPGQGALAVQCRADAAICERVRALTHEPTRLAVETERTLLRILGTGCHTPLGAYAVCKDDVVCLTAQLLSEDGAHEATEHLEGNDAEALAQRIADALQQSLNERLERP